MVTVSVIIPSYNRGHTLGRAINSVLSQKTQSFELIIVDDGSTDDTVFKVQSIKDSRIQLIQHPYNRGVSAARNTGIRASKGKYIAFLDSDDEWLPQKLMEQIHAMELAPLEIGGCATGFILHRIETEVYESRSLPKIQNWRKYLIQGCSLSPGSTFMVRRTCLEDIGLFDEQLIRFEDWEWLLRLIHKYKIIGLSNPLAIIHLGTWPGVEIVNTALNKFSKYIEHSSSLDIPEKRLIGISLELEKAVAVWRNGFRLKGGYKLLAIFLRFPVIAFPFISRIVLRRIRRWFGWGIDRSHWKSSVVVTVGHQMTAALQSNSDLSLIASSYAVLTLDELKYSLKHHPFSFFQRYKNGILLVDALDSCKRSFVLSLILRFMCSESIEIRDLRNQHLPLNFFKIINFSFKALKDYFRKQKLLNELKSSCQALLKVTKPRYLLNLKARPLYLRTDLVFGVRAGGSVGHIAGVLNNLDKFTGTPIFLTSDLIPTVRKDIETFQIPTEDLYWNLPEIPNLAFNNRVLSFSESIVQNQNLAFIYQRYSLGNISGIQMARSLKIPFVCEYNGPEIWIARHWGRPLRYERLSMLVEETNLRCADLIVVISRAIQQDLIKRGIVNNRILVNPNGVDVTRYHPDNDGSIIRKNLDLNDRIVIGFIGTFGCWHGAEVLAEAFGRLYAEGIAREWRLLMIGDGNTKERARSVIKQYGAEPSTIFTGIVPQEEGPSFLSACDILVSPHIPNPDGTPFFGSPTKLFEYMAMGKAIVASNLDQIGEILQHNETAWLVKPGDPEELSKGLLKLSKDPELRFRLGAAARCEVVDKYSWEAHTKRIIDKLITVTT